ncbi:MAG TPA: hypothetical protein VKQ36_09850 [Ktedonobacterales bacterium]|nr:hypothetical protein [Ktedonobacterales bacterium]
MEHDEDFLDDLIAERTKHNPAFPQMVEDALRRRKARRHQAHEEAALLPAGQAEEHDATTPTTTPARWR